jgi:long-chain fatty acid transport protein
VIRDRAKTTIMPHRTSRRNSGPPRLFLRWTLAPVALAAALVSGPAAGAGFGVDYEGARAVGTATAGSVSAGDASTIFYNAAGLGFLPGNEILAGGALFLLEDRFENQRSTILGARPTPGTNGPNAIPPIFVPWVYATYRPAPEWTLGFGLYSPFGLRSDYGPSWVGRYQNEVTSLTAVNFNPSVSYRPLRWISFGAGIDVQYVSVRLTQAIDFGSACASAIGAGTCAGAFGLVPGASDGQVDNRGNGLGYGYNLGLILEPTVGTRVGFAYRSGIDQHISGGKQSFVVPPPARAFLVAGGTPLAFTGSSISTGLRLPGRLNFGLQQSLGPNINLLLDATLTLWSVFDQTAITAQNRATGASAAIQQGYQNAWRFAAGLEWGLGPQWQLRTGFAYDQTPIPRQMVQAALPDADRVYLSAGATFRFRTGWAADIGYSHVFYVDHVPIDRSAAGNVLNGVFTSSGDIIAAQLRLRY